MFFYGGGANVWVMLLKRDVFSLWMRLTLTDRYVECPGGDWWVVRGAVRFFGQF